MDVAVLQKSHEEYWLAEGHYLLLQFQEGWVPLRITGRGWSSLKPYSFGGVAAGNNLAVWDEVTDAGGRRYFNPHIDKLIYHIFWGLNEPKARVYVQYLSGQNVASLVSIERPITPAALANVGAIRGEESPYDGPFSQKTELITVHERYPAYNILNPTPDPMDDILMHAEIMKYTYVVLKDRDLVRKLLNGERPRRMYTMGRIDPSPMTIPAWLNSLIPSGMLDWTRDVMAGTEKTVASAARGGGR